MHNRRRNFIICIILLIVVFAVWQIMIAVSHRGKLLVTIKVSPSDALVSIDGNRTRSKQVYVTPGKHIFEGKRKYFGDYSTSWEVSPETVSKPVILLLEASSPQAQEYLTNHPKEQSLREALGGQLANIQGEEAIKNTPLVTQLPFIDLEYRIDYGPSLKSPDDPTAISITITSTSEVSKQDALDWIRFKGFDPNKLEIIYESF